MHYETQAAPPWSVYGGAGPMVMRFGATSKRVMWTPQRIAGNKSALLAVGVTFLHERYAAPCGPPYPCRINRRKLKVKIADIMPRHVNTTNPVLKDPVVSLSHPIVTGPTKPPSAPTEFMKARPPAAATPDRNPAGIVQKIARAAVTPINANVKPMKLGMNDPANTEVRRPAAARKQLTARFPVLLPPRSTCLAQNNMPIVAQT
jgi:hypothetical protein